MSGVFCCMLFFLPKAWLQLRLNGKAECAKRISVVRFLKQVYKPTDAILEVSKVFKLKLRFKKASFYHKLPNRTECEESTCTLETLPSGFPTDCEQTLVLIRLDSFRSNIWGVVVHFRSSFATIHLYIHALQGLKLSKSVSHLSFGPSRFKQQAQMLWIALSQGLAQAVPALWDLTGLRSHFCCRIISSPRLEMFPHFVWGRPHKTPSRMVRFEHV